MDNDSVVMLFPAAHHGAVADPVRLAPTCRVDPSAMSCDGNRPQLEQPFSLSPSRPGVFRDQYHRLRPLDPMNAPTWGVARIGSRLFLAVRQPPISLISPVS